MFLKLLLIIVSIVVNCVSSSNFYTVISNVQQPYNNQYLSIFDPTIVGNQPDTIYMGINYQVLSIVSTTPDNDIILLCSTAYDESVLVQYNINSSEVTELASVPTTQVYGLTTQTISFSDKAAYMVVGGGTKDNINLVKLDFSKQTSTPIQVEAPGYTQGNTVTQGFDYSKNILYLGYSSPLGQLNVVSINVNDDQTNSTTYYMNIQGVTSSEISLIFIDNNSNLYLLEQNNAISGCSDNYGCYSFCKVVPGFQGSKYRCAIVLDTLIGSSSSMTQYIPYNQFFVSMDHQSVVLIAPISNSPNLMTFTSFNINNGMIPIKSNFQNVWYNYNYQIYASVAY